MPYKVFWKGNYPKKKKQYYLGEFSNKEKAYQWCRNRYYQYEGLHIEYPDGTAKIRHLGNGLNQEKNLDNNLLIWYD